MYKRQALLFSVGASSGGTDVIALIVEKYTHLHSIAAALFLTDLVMVVAVSYTHLTMPPSLQSTWIMTKLLPDMTL